MVHLLRLNREMIPEQTQGFPREPDLIEIEPDSDLIGPTAEQAEKKRKIKRQFRSLSLIAEFRNGFSVGWFYAIPDAFRDMLDIQYIERKEPVLIDGKIQYTTKVDKKGKPRKVKKTRPVMRWTQGKEYCFSEGHVLYDTEAAYLPKWADAIKRIKFRIEIIRATKKGLDKETGKEIDGSVTFILQTPDSEKKRLTTIGQFHMTQAGFVDYLKTGELEKNRLQV